MRRKVEAIVMVPQRVEFETSAKDGPEMTSAAHMAVAGLHSLEGFEPKLMRTRVIETTSDPRIEAYPKRA